MQAVLDDVLPSRTMDDDEFIGFALSDDEEEEDFDDEDEEDEDEDEIELPEEDGLFGEDAAVVDEGLEEEEDDLDEEEDFPEDTDEEE